MTIEIMNSYKEAKQGNDLPLHEAVENNACIDAIRLLLDNDKDKKSVMEIVLERLNDLGALSVQFGGVHGNQSRRILQDFGMVRRRG